MKKALLALLFIPLISLSSYGSHLMGGEITWDCLGSGQYVFTLRLYRDCNGVQGPAVVSIRVHNNPNRNSIPLTLISQLDNSPPCNDPLKAITCTLAESQTGYPNSSTPVQGAVEEYVYQSAPVTLAGIPPVNGWIFTFDDCCRNAALTNIYDADNHGYSLRAKMFAYNGKNTNPCYDSSPEFFEKPKAILCTGYPFTFNHNAVDTELDSIHYEWAKPLDYFDGSCGTKFNATCPQELMFNSGYSYNSPLPGPSVNPLNVPAVLDPNTGEVQYTSYTQGNFVMVVEVSAYKCGVLVAQVYREIQVVLVACADMTPGVKNRPPQVVPPFLDALGNQTSYIDTVYAGDFEDFFLTCTDVDQPSPGVYQNISITASGPEFDANFTNPNGSCLLPPCATLTPPPSMLTGQQTLTTQFKWQTTCANLGFNLGCLSFSNVYNFIIKSSDDFCPIPGLKFSTVTIVVLPPPPLEPPLLKCANVASNGDVTLSWVPKPDTANRFRALNIYYSKSQGGPYTLVDSIVNYAQTTFTHIGANAVTDPAYYYLLIHSGCSNGTLPVSSDTLQAIHLTVLNPGTGYANLSWNATHSPPVSSNSLYYKIYKEYPAGTWTFLDSTKQLTYSDPITVCHAIINYRIEISDSSGCTSVSNFDGKLFQDILPPAIPVMDSVSVDANGVATISWNKDASGDVIAYIIYKCNGINNCVPIDTVYGINTLSYISSIDATLQSDSFCIAAFDSCAGNTSPLSVIHNTIHVNGSLDICSSSITLNWNPYVNWPTGVDKYEIYASVNGGAYNLVGSSSTTTFVHTSLTPLSNYTYVVRAVDATHTKTSGSNTYNVTATVLQVPLFQYVKTASVVGDNSAYISAYVDVAADIISYKIFRSTASGGPFEIVGNVPVTGSALISFTDKNVPVGDRSYYYKVSAVDSCGNDAFVSQHGRTIHTVARPNDNLSNTVDWNDYEIWLGGVDHYNIYRNVDGVTNPVPLASIPYGQPTTYTDNIANLIYTSGKFCYYIEAVEGPTNIYGFTDTSYSNLGCATQKPMTFIPSAFHPEGPNSVLMPMTSFVNATDYSLDIYNRWGERVFHADSPNSGWDGTYKGRDASGGVYVYFAKMKGTDGTDIERKGTVTLVR